MIKITKITLDERADEYYVMLYSGSKFLMNDGNTLYFEANLKDGELPSVVQHKLYVVEFRGNDFTWIPENSSYICSFKDNANVRYFVYEDISNNPVVQFMNLFNI